MFRKLFAIGSVILLALPVAHAAVPGQINHQGVIKVNGTVFNGSGQFRFAIFDPDTGQNYWTNDNTFVPGPGTPTAFVPIQVTDGIYSVRLGDTTLTGMTNTIPPSVFNDSNAALRVWFNDGVNGIQQFDPHPLTTSPYSHRAATVDAKYLFRGSSNNAIFPVADQTLLSFEEALDPSNSYSGNNTFTAPVTGYYFVSTHITYYGGSANGTDSTQYQIRVNGVSFLNGNFDANSNAFGGQPITQSISGVLSLQQGEAVQVWVNDIGSTFGISTRHFSGFLIGQ